MTEPNTEIPEREVELLGRKLFVRFPQPEQLLVWQRTLTKLQGADVDGWNAVQVMSALERMRKIIDSLLANKTDVDWLDDQMLDGNVGLMELVPFFTDVVKTFADEANGTNREARRTAAKTPAKKAVRKAAPRKATAR